MRRSGLSYSGLFIHIFHILSASLLVVCHTCSGASAQMIRVNEVMHLVPQKAKITLAKMNQVAISHDALGLALNSSRADEITSVFCRVLGCSPNNDRRAAAIASKISEEAQINMQKGSFEFGKIKNMYMVVLAWLLPKHMKVGRSNKNMWSLCAFLSSISGAYDLVNFCDHRKQLRVMLRGFGAGVQDSILNKHFSNKHWYVFIRCLYASMFCPDKLPKHVKAGVYYMWAHQQKVWYIGKANTTRDEYGMSSRFKEHMLATFRPPVYGGTEKRYQSWRCCSQHSMCFIPFAWGKENQILDYERFVINHLQAPMQDRAKPGSFHANRFRPWKRFRTNKSHDDEIKLNICGHLRGFEQKKTGGHQGSHTCYQLPTTVYMAESFRGFK